MKTIGSVLVLFTAMLVIGRAYADDSPNVSGPKEDIGQTPVEQKPAIPFDQIGAVAGRQYSGDGLAIVSTDDGALLRCVFQRLEGQATKEGLWLKSTVPPHGSDRFRVKAMAVGQQSLPERGDVSLEDGIVRFSRPGLIEEYSVSMDGVRQDFVVLEKPAGEPGLKVQLRVEGAVVNQTAYGAQLVLEKSGRKIAYNRLRVADATGRELAVRIEVSGQSQIRNPKPDIGLAVVVDDAQASYPVRIDPTFSDANWVSVNSSVPGSYGAVGPVAVDSSGNLYIGCSGKVVGGIIANGIAKWDGSSWSALGSGMGYGNETASVNALAVSGKDVYAGGSFITAGGVTAICIAKWDGSSWSPLGTGLNGNVSALAISGSDVYAAGSFSTAGGISARRIAKWNGSSWSALGGGLNGNVSALASSGNDVFVGGSFTAATNSGDITVAASRIARWDGSTWSPLAGGVNDRVLALLASGNDLYVGGFFVTATNTNNVAATVNRIAKWNGNSWSALGGGMNSYVSALAISGNDLYVSGDFSTAGGISASRIAKWTGSSWSPLGTGVGDFVGGLAVFGSNVYAGGRFWTAGSVAVSCIAKWDGSSWNALGAGINYTVYALAVSEGQLYVGGSFRRAGGVAANRIAKWNGSAWSALGSGLDNSVRALAVSGSNLYAGGNFSTAGGVSAKGIAKWDGDSWSALGPGINASMVYALALFGSNLYVGGSFSGVAGSSGLKNVARWDGTNWRALGGGLNNIVYALAVSGDEVYAGGHFLWATNVGNVPVAANRIAKWDGNTWSPLGMGLSDRVNALAVSGSNVYAGGAFRWATNTGSATATVNLVAKWDGSAWSALGPGFEGYSVSALVASGDDLYAGGSFWTAGGTDANNVAKWDGGTWSALGSGLDHDVNALVVSDGSLYLGGQFSTAGAIVSPFVARAVLTELAFPGIITTNGGFGISHGLFGFQIAGAPGQTVVIEGSSNLVTWTGLKTNLVLGNPIDFSDPEWTNVPHRFYRLRSP